MRGRLNPWRRSERSEDSTGRKALDGAPALGGIGHGILGDVGLRHVENARLSWSMVVVFSHSAAAKAKRNTAAERMAALRL
jgi:hypothetical protein